MFIVSYIIYDLYSSTQMQARWRLKPRLQLVSLWIKYAIMNHKIDIDFFTHCSIKTFYKAKIYALKSNARFCNVITYLNTTFTF